MRHLKAGNRLGKTTAHRRAMMRNMVTSILENGQITCTLARAKEVRKPLEKMISWGKRGDLHSRRLALRFVKSKKAMSNLFEELAVRYKNRQGGYSRIIKLGKKRLGDNSEMAIVQLLGSDSDSLSSLKKTKSQKKIPLKNKDQSILKEVSEEVQSEENVSKNKNINTITTKSVNEKSQKIDKVDKVIHDAGSEKKENTENEKSVNEKSQKIDKVDKVTPDDNSNK